MKIVNWNKINGITYKGYVIGAPTSHPHSDTYSANVYDLNGGFNSNKKINLTMELQPLGFLVSIKYGLKSGTTDSKVEVLQFEKAKSIDGFIKIYESLIDWYEHKKK